MAGQGPAVGKHLVILLLQREGPSTSCPGSLSVKATSVAFLLSGAEHCWKVVEQLPPAKTWLSQNSIDRPGRRNWLWRIGKSTVLAEI